MREGAPGNEPPDACSGTGSRGRLRASLFAPPAALAWTPGFQPYEAYETSSWPESVAIADVTGDGRNDVLMTTSFYFDEANDFKLFVFPQQADGSLGLPTKMATTGAYGDSMGLAVGDLDGDGATDAAIATESGINAFYQRAGALVGPQPILGSPRAAHQVIITDLNADGLNDLGVTSGEGVVVLTNGTTGYVRTPVSTEGVFELEHGHLNGDALPDLVGIYARQLRLFEQTPSGAFGARSIGLTGDWGGQGLEVADVAGGDGRQDVVITTGGNRPASEVQVYEQRSPGGIASTPLTYASYDIPEPVEAADMTGDALEDVVTVHGGWLKAGLYPQLAGGGLGFEALFDVPYASHYNSKGLALGDLNCDGRRDIAIADYNHGLVLLRHTPAGPTAIGGACEPPTAEPNGPPPGGTAPSRVRPVQPPRTGPRKAASGPRLTVIRRWRRGDRRIRIRLACDKPCLVLAKGIVTLRRGSSARSAAARRLRLAPALKRLGANDPRTLRLRIPARTRRAVLRGLARGARPTARVLVTATDDNGNSTARTIRVRMRD